MALATAAQYFDDAEATWRMNSDLGRKGMLPLELIGIADRYFAFDVRSIAFTDTPTSLWFERSRWWLTSCFLLSPLVALWLAWRMRRNGNAGAARLLALILFGLFCSQFLLSPVIAFRYLHPFPPLVILSLAAPEPGRDRRAHARAWDVVVTGFGAASGPAAPADHHADDRPSPLTGRRRECAGRYPATRKRRGPSPLRGVQSGRRPASRDGSLPMPTWAAPGDEPMPE
jgi:hypothetical protein